MPKMRDKPVPNAPLSLDQKVRQAKAAISKGRKTARDAANTGGNRSTAARRRLQVESDTLAKVEAILARPNAKS